MVQSMTAEVLTADLRESESSSRRSVEFVLIYVRRHRSGTQRLRDAAKAEETAADRAAAAAGLPAAAEHRLVVRVSGANV